LSGIAGVFAPILHVGGVVVDFPKELAGADFKAPKVVFAVWIVVLGEVIERLNGNEGCL